MLLTPNSEYPQQNCFFSTSFILLWEKGATTIPSLLEIEFDFEKHLAFYISHFERDILKRQQLASEVLKNIKISIFRGSCIRTN